MIPFILVSHGVRVMAVALITPWVLARCVGPLLARLHQAKKVVLRLHLFWEESVCAKRKMRNYWEQVHILRAERNPMGTT